MDWMAVPAMDLLLDENISGKGNVEMSSCCLYLLAGIVGEAGGGEYPQFRGGSVLRVRGILRVPDATSARPCGVGKAYIWSGGGE